MDYVLQSGAHDAQGPRRTMEDTHKCIDDVKSSNSSQNVSACNYRKIAYYAVFDGHGGDQTAKMVENALHPKIFVTNEFASGDVKGAIAKGFEEMDKVVVEEANKQNAMHGCTGVVCLILDNEMYIANIGDSEAILVSVVDDKVSPQNMTTPHKATDPAERARIEELGGHVFFGRVFGSLAVSRSFGDAKYKKPTTSQNFVSFEPAIQKETLAPTHKYLVMACDGLWDVMNHQVAATKCHEAFQAGKSPSEVAKCLVDEALKLRTEDNVTVVVVKIDWPSQQSSPANPTVTTTSTVTTEVTTTTTTTATPQDSVAS